MKKLLLLLILCVFCISANAQEIVANGVSMGNGKLLYATSDIKIFKGKELNSGIYSEVGISLACEYTPKTKAKRWVVALSLITDGKITIKEGMQILFKGTDGTITTLKNEVEHFPKYWAERDMYFTAANYPTFAKQFQTLKTKQIKKIRIVSTIKKLDYTLNGDEIKNAIKSCYDVIQKELQNARTGVYDNF